VFSIAELLFGLTLIMLGAYLYLLIRDCPTDSHDCVGWGLLGAALFFPPGVLIATAGTLSYFWRRMPLVPIQLVLVVVLISYYFLMGFE
jgi:hypothetical protein